MLNQRGVFKNPFELRSVVLQLFLGQLDPGQTRLMKRTTILPPPEVAVPV